MNKRQREAVAAVENIKALIQANFGGKDVDDFTEESFHAALAAVNEPFIRLLLGIAPNRKGKEEASSRNPRTTSAQALDLSAAYKPIENIGNALRDEASSRKKEAKPEEAQVGGIKSDPNAPKGIITSGDSVQIVISPYSAEGLTRFYNENDFSNLILNAEEINHLYRVAEEILVTNPRKKAGKVVLWTAIAVGSAAGVYLIVKAVNEHNEHKKEINSDVDLDAAVEITEETPNVVFISDADVVDLTDGKEPSGISAFIDL